MLSAREQQVLTTSYFYTCKQISVPICTPYILKTGSLLLLKTFGGSYYFVTAPLRLLITRGSCIKRDEECQSQGLKVGRCWVFSTTLG